MNRPLKWRYVVIGLGFVGLAGVRASQGELVWAAVFAVAAAVNFWLGVHEGARSAAAPSAAAAPERSEVERSLAGYRTSARQWQALGAVGVLLGGVLLVIEPGLAVFAGAAALFALYRGHRAGRAVATLRRAELSPRCICTAGPPATGPRSPGPRARPPAPAWRRRTRPAAGTSAAGPPGRRRGCSP